MVQRADFLKKQINDTAFFIRIYEMYRKKTPADRLAHDICAEYRSRYSALIKEYAALCGDGGKYDGI